MAGAALPELIPRDRATLLDFLHGACKDSPVSSSFGGVEDQRGQVSSQGTADPIDHEALQSRYRLERDKRIRPDGNDQYLEPTGPFARLIEDPWTPWAEREPIEREVEVAIIGAGFGGLVTGARLKAAGIEEVMLIDGAGDVGGAWYWNRYPGAMCDTAAMIYLPLLEETGRWIIRTDRGDEIRARYVAMGTGPLHRPKLPGIPGIETFAGHTFHTSRWDYAYTGGDPNGSVMTGLADKRVGIIGTGATAVQCIPHLAAAAGVDCASTMPRLGGAHLARSAQSLHVFQRTPSSVDVRNNHPIDADWFATLEPGWQRSWLHNFATLQTGGFAAEDLVQDGWTDISQRIRDRVVAEIERGEPFTPETLKLAYELSDDEKMSEIRARVDAVVSDPATAEALKPWYRQLCKRPCFHDDYLQAYNEPSTVLVDTDGKGVGRIDETGVWVAGQHYELDCIVFASGFEVGTELARRAGFEVTGRDDLTLSDHWSDGMRTLHGTHVRGFPNLFIIGMTQGANLISNITSNLVEAGTTIAAVVAHASSIGSRTVEVSAEAEADWVELVGGGSGGFLGNADCTPGYYNNEGQAIGRRQHLDAGGYPQGPMAFFSFIENWRNDGRFEGLEFV